jgi:hypothetical protein
MNREACLIWSARTLFGEIPIYRKLSLLQQNSKSRQVFNLPTFSLFARTICFVPPIWTVNPPRWRSRESNLPLNLKRNTVCGSLFETLALGYSQIYTIVFQGAG